MFGPKTIDKVIKVFNDTITDLNVIIAQKEDEKSLGEVREALLNEQIKQLHVDRANIEEDIALAENIRTKIQDFIS